MSASGALEELSKVESLSGALELRTTGITWLIWSLAVPGIFLTHSTLSLATQPSAVGRTVMGMTLWIPWVATAAAATHMLWHSAGLVVPSLSSEHSRRQGIYVGITFILLYVGIFQLLAWVGVGWTEPALALAVGGVAYTLVGIMGWLCTTPGDRYAWIGVGLVMLSVALTGSLLMGRTAVAYEFFSWAAPLAAWLPAFLVGLTMTLRA